MQESAMNILLIGAGNMGGAMLAGLDSYDVTVVEKSEERRIELQKLYPDVKFAEDIPPLDSYVVLLAVKPQTLQKLETEGRAEALISILAGIPISKLKENISAKAYIRAMPNIAALKRKSVTSVTGDESFRREALEILSCTGRAVWLDSEEHLDIATGIGGSAPAWLAMVAEALADGAVDLGLPREKSYEYAAAMMEGTGSMLMDEHPALLKDRVMSPGGTTAAGYAALEAGGVRESFIKAMRECYIRSKKL
jgi:pyrroline-5-carboxylate reductase